MRFLDRECDGDALARCQAVGLHDERGPEGRGVFFGRGDIREALVGCRRDVVLGAEVLEEALRSLESRRRGRGPEDADARGAEVVCQAVDQGLLGPDDDEADPLLLAPGDDGAVVGDVEARDGGHRGLQCDSGVGRRAEQRATAGRVAQLPRQGMLSPSGAHDEDVDLDVAKEEEGEKEKEVRVGVEVKFFFDRKTRGERKEKTFERAHFHLLLLF